MKKLFMIGLCVLSATTSLPAAFSKMCEPVHDGLPDDELVAAVRRLRVSNPERKIPFYLAVTNCIAVAGEPPSLKTDLDLDTLVESLTRLTTDDQTKAYYRGMGEAIRFTQELVHKPIITPDDIQQLNFLLVGNVGAGISPLRPDRAVVSRAGVDPLDFDTFRQAIDLINASTGSGYFDGSFLRGNTPVSRLLRAVHIGGNVRGEWLAEYYNYAFTRNSDLRLGETIKPYPFIRQFAKKYPEAAAHLFTTRLTKPALLPSELPRLCDMINRTFTLTSHKDCFVAALAAAEDVFYKIAVDHYFEDGNGRTARMIVALICARAGLLAPVMSTEKYDTAVAAFFNGECSLAVSFCKALRDMQRTLAHEPPFTIAGCVKMMTGVHRK